MREPLVISWNPYDDSCAVDGLSADLPVSGSSPVGRLTGAMSVAPVFFISLTFRCFFG